MKITAYERSLVGKPVLRGCKEEILTVLFMRSFTQASTTTGFICIKKSLVEFKSRAFALKFQNRKCIVDSAKLTKIAPSSTSTGAQRQCSPFLRTGETQNLQHRAKPFRSEPLGSAPTPQRSGEKSVSRHLCAPVLTVLGGVMFRFRYKASGEMGTGRFVGPAADAVVFPRSLQ